MTEMPVTVMLPDKDKWLAATVISTSVNVQAEIEIKKDNANYLAVKTGLLKPNEYVRFQALAEVSIGEKTDHDVDRQGIVEQLESTMVFDHRISDTHAIENVELRTDARVKRRLRFLFPLAILGSLMCVFLILQQEDLLRWPREHMFVYKQSSDSSKLCAVTAQPISQNEIRIRDIARRSNRKMSLEEFFGEYRDRPTVMKLSVPYSVPLGLTIFFSLGYAGGPWALVFMSYGEIRSNRRLRRLLGIEDYKQRRKKSFNVLKSGINK